MSNPHGQKVNKMPKPENRNFRQRFATAGRGRGVNFSRLQPGNMSRPQGNASRPQGIAIRARGSTTRLRGNATRPQGNASQPQGNASRPQGNQSRPQGNQPRPPGNQSRPQGNQSRPQGNQPRPQGKRSHPQGIAGRQKLNASSKLVQPQRQPSSWTRKEKKSVLFNLLKDLSPEVRKEFQQYPPVVQILARIAMGSSPDKSNEAFQLLGVQGLPRDDYNALADKFRPLISKLVQSASAPALENDPGPSAAENVQHSNAGPYHSQPGPSRLDYGGDGGFPAENYNNLGVLQDSQNNQNYNFPMDNSAIGMANYMSVYTQQTMFTGPENTGVPDGAGGSFMGHMQPDTSNTLASGLNISFTVPPPIILPNSAYPNAPNFYPNSGNSMGNFEPPAVEPLQTYHLPEQQAESYDPTSPTSSQHQGSDMSEQDMLPSSPLNSRSRESPSEFDTAAIGHRGRPRPEACDTTKELSEEDKLYREFFNFMSTKGRASTASNLADDPSCDDRPRDEQSADFRSPGRRSQGYDSSSQEDDSIPPDHNRITPDHNRILPDHNRIPPDRSRGLLDHNHRLLDQSQGSPNHNRILLDQRQRSPDRNLRLPDHSRRLLDNSQRSPNRISRSPDRTHSSLDNSHRSLNRNQRSSENRARLPNHARRSPENSCRLPNQSSRSPDHSRRSLDNSRRSQDHSQKSLDNSRRSQDHNRRLADHSRKSPDRNVRLPDRSRKSPDRSRRSLELSDKPAESRVPSFFRISVTEAISGRRLSRTEAEMIELALLKRITAKDDIKCHGVYRESGAVVFVCDDEKSARWVSRTVPFLLPWAGAAFKAEPWTKRSTSTELLFELPSILTHMPWAGLCEKIHQQNARLPTSEWKLIVDEETTRVCSVDRMSLKILKKQNFKAFVGFSQIEFKLISEEK